MKKNRASTFNSSLQRGDFHFQTRRETNREENLLNPPKSFEFGNLSEYRVHFPRPVS